MTLDQNAISAMLLSAAKLLCEHTDRLSEIDSRFGDGDHGITIGKIAALALIALLSGISSAAGTILSLPKLMGAAAGAVSGSASP